MFRETCAFSRRRLHDQHEAVHNPVSSHLRLPHQFSCPGSYASEAREMGAASAPGHCSTRDVLRKLPFGRSWGGAFDVPSVRAVSLASRFRNGHQTTCRLASAMTAIDASWGDASSPAPNSLARPGGRRAVYDDWLLHSVCYSLCSAEDDIANFITIPREVYDCTFKHSQAH